MVRTTIHLMRHGEVHNPEGVLYGCLPGYHLSDLGRQMVQQVADVLSATGHDVTHVITSPLERARESGAPTAAAFGLRARTDFRLIEAGNHFEGLAVNRDRRVLAHPRYWRSYVNPWRPSWGEPYTELVERMRAAVASALVAARGHEALLVSHQLPVWALRLFLERRPLAHDPRRRQCALASVTSLTFEDSTLVGLAYWEPAGHLLRQATDMVPGTSAAAEATGVPAAASGPGGLAGAGDHAAGADAQGGAAPRPGTPAAARPQEDAQEDAAGQSGRTSRASQSPQAPETPEASQGRG